MRKAALVVAGALALPLVFALPAAARGLIEQAQDEGMRQAREATQKQLQKHLTPDQIKRVQQALEQKGFPIERTDGVNGRETRRALRSFQRQLRMQPTGQPDERTLQALGVDLNGSTTGAAPTETTLSNRGRIEFRQHPPGNGGNASSPK